MAAEIPYAVKVLPAQAAEIAIRYAHLSSVPYLREPLETFLREFAEISVFPGVSIELFTHGRILKLKPFIDYKSVDPEGYGQFGRVYYRRFSKGMRKFRSQIDIRLSYITTAGNDPQELMPYYLERYFEPSEFAEFGLDEEMHDEVPVITLGMVDRSLEREVRMHVLNSATIGLNKNSSSDRAILN